jgi:1,4-dihydroxy-2-naphthoyl-CoA synthase
MPSEHLFVEASRLRLAAATDDMREGTRAFVAKRKPEFKNR